MFSPLLCSYHMFHPFYFIFTIHTKSEPSKTPVKSIQTTIEDRSYLLARLFARHLLPSDTISQGLTKHQLPRPLLHELVMRLYISRYRVQGDSRRWQSLTTGWRGDRWWNRTQYWTLQPWGDILRRRQQVVINVVNGLCPLLPCDPTPVEFTGQRPFARCCLPPLDLEPPLWRIAIFARRWAWSSTMQCTTLSCSHGTSVRLLHTRRARRQLRNLIVDNKGIFFQPQANSEQGINLLEAVNLVLEIFNLSVFWLA